MLNASTLITGLHSSILSDWFQRIGDEVEQRKDSVIPPDPYIDAQCETLISIATENAREIVEREPAHLSWPSAGRIYHVPIQEE